MRLATRQLPGRHLGVDFNPRILDRVAKERFAETRTQAYMPKAAPSFVWRRLVPAVVSVFAVAVVAISLVGLPSGKSKDGLRLAEGVNIGENDDYITAHPRADRIAHLNPQWSLNNHLAQTDRMARVTNSMTQTAGFERRGALTGIQAEFLFRDSRNPNTIYYYRVRPVIRVDNQTATNASYKESDKVY
jgi:hypothetical protein